MANDKFNQLNKNETIILYAANAFEKQAMAIAEKYNFKLNIIDEDDLTKNKNNSQQQYFPLWFLFLNKNGLGLHYRDNNTKPLLINFDSAKNTYRLSKASIKSEAIAKAAGMNGKIKPRVLDLTAGLGQDAMVLASLGCEVTMVERSPIVAALLSDGIARFKNKKENHAALLDVHFADAREILKKINENTSVEKNNINKKTGTEVGNTCLDNFDVIYLDPMFPEDSYQKATTKKEMRMLHAILSENECNNDDLLVEALKTKVRRVVVKRPKGADFLADIKPHHSKHGRSNRFDIYLNDL